MHSGPRTTPASWNKLTEKLETRWCIGLLFIFQMGKHISITIFEHHS